MMISSLYRVMIIFSPHLTLVIVQCPAPTFTPLTTNSLTRSNPLPNANVPRWHPISPYRTMATSITLSHLVSLQVHSNMSEHQMTRAPIHLPLTTSCLLKVRKTHQVSLGNMTPKAAQIVERIKARVGGRKIDRLVIPMGLNLGKRKNSAIVCHPMVFCRHDSRGSH